MNLSHSLVDSAHSWYSQEPFLSDVASSYIAATPTGSQVVFCNKTFPSATAALEAYIDEYFGHSKRGHRRYGGDCVADLLLVKPVSGVDTSSLPSVSVMSSSESQARGVGGGSGIKMTEGFAGESSAAKNYSQLPAGTSLYESTRDLDRILAESQHSLHRDATPTDHLRPPTAFIGSPHKQTSPVKIATFTHAELQKIRSRVCDNASYRSFLDQSRIHRSTILSRSLDSLLSNHNDSDSTLQDSDDKYSSDGGRCPPSWIQEVESEEEVQGVDGTIVSGHMLQRKAAPRDKTSQTGFNIAVSTPKQAQPLQHTYSPGRNQMTSRNASSLGNLQVALPSGSLDDITSSSPGMRLRHACLQSTDSPDMINMRAATFDSRMDYTIDNGSLRDTYFDSKSLSWSRVADSTRPKTPSLRDKQADFSQSVDDIQVSPERRSLRHKRGGSPGKTVCFDFTPQEQRRKLPPVYDLMAPWLKDSQREAYLRRLDHDIEESPSSFAGDSVCSSSNDRSLGTSLGVCGNNAVEGANGGKDTPLAQQPVNAYSCSNLPEVGGFLEKVRCLLATPPPYDSRSTAAMPDTPTSEQILDGERSWEKTPTKSTPASMRQLGDLMGTMDADRIVAALLNSTSAASQGEGVLNYDSQKPGTKEALKNILFAMQSTMGTTVSPATATTTVTPTSSQTQASGTAQSEQRRQERVKNMADSLTPESRQLLAARSTQEAGGESLERALVHLARLKELVENTKECLH